MKFVPALILMLAMTTQSFATPNSSLEVIVEDGSILQVELLGNELDESEVEILWERGGAEAVYLGNLCFNGSQPDAKKMLELLNKMDFLGDEYRIININIENVKNNGVEYQIFDGPNEEVAADIRMDSCS